MTTAQDQQSRYPAEFEKWARDRGLISSSHGITAEWSSLSVALEAWQAARALPAGVEPAASVYTMQALVPGGREVSHVTLHQDLPRGTKLYTAAQVLAMGRVPPGWQAVPLEPSIGMLRALVESMGADGQPFATKWAVGSFDEDYRAMLAAAPRPPAAQNDMGVPITAAQERKPLTHEQIHKWWASENGLEDSDMGRLADFTTVVREVESKLGIK